MILLRTDFFALNWHLMSIITLTEDVYGENVEALYIAELKRQSQVHEQEKKDWAERLRQQKEETQNLMAEINKVKTETGGDDNTPLPTRVKKLSHSLKKDTNLQEAVSILGQKLAGIPGEDCGGKVDALIAERDLTKRTANELNQRL